MSLFISENPKAKIQKLCVKFSNFFSAHQLGKGHLDLYQKFKAYHSTVRKITHKWETFETVAVFPEWMPQQIHPNVKQCNAQRNSKTCKSYTKIHRPYGIGQEKN